MEKRQKTFKLAHMSSVPDVRQVRAALFTSLLLGLIGLWGLTNAASDFTLASSISSIPMETGDPHRDAGLAFSHAYHSLQLSSASTRILASVNFVASAMLFIGSFLLSSRSQSTIWWVRNAVALNALFIVAETVVRVQLLHDNFRTLLPHVRLVLERSSDESVREQIAAAAPSMLPVMISGMVFFALVRLAIQAYLFYRVGTERVRGFIETAR